MGLLDDKVCVITGGAGSVGLASARLFLDEGAKVMLVDLDDAAIARAVTDLASPRVDGIVADVSQAAPTRHYVERTVARFGAIDVLFSNAGNQGVVAPVTDYPEEVFDALLAVHVRGAFLACKYGLLVEQNVHHSLRLADRVHVLENGRVVRSGTPAELRQDKAIQQAYLGL
jgi:NAD(P)-dependent dehydrogenase (short-subunit alcohol dehydrogenase family)